MRFPLCLFLIENFYKVLCALLCFLSTISCWRQYGEEYPPGIYSKQSTYDVAMDTLQNAPPWVPEWPNESIKMGQVSGVAIDSSGCLLVFHRATNAWGIGTFTKRNVYTQIGDPPIGPSTVLVFNQTGQLMDMWGQNMFYMPHGISVDHEDNVWLTDVALHQVFKFNKQDRNTPALTLGEKFVPGDDEEHLCKPSAVAVMASGEFFVADGYCNSRIIKYSPKGIKILEWGQRHEGSPFSLNIPHALTLTEGEQDICVADREHGRVACFSALDGTFRNQYRSWLIGGKCFSVAYAAGHLYVVNGPYGNVPRVRGFVLEYPSGRLVQTFGPNGDFTSPHDIAVTPDGSTLYVAQLDPHRVFKFYEPSLVNHTKVAPLHTNKATAPAKPTATTEWSEGASEAWGWKWVAGGGGAALAAITTAMLLLLRAKRQGRKGVRRRWEYGGSQFKLRRLLERRRFTRVDTSDSDEEAVTTNPRLTAAA